MDRRRHDAFLQGQHRGDGLDGARGAEHVAVHRLGAADVGLVGEIAHRDLICLGLGHVVEERARAVGVDIDIVLGGIESGLLQRDADALGLGGAVRARGRGVVGVAGAAVARDLGIDVGAAGLGVLHLLEDDDGGTVGHHEAAAVGVERQGGVLRIRGAGQRLGVREAGDTDRYGTAVAAARDDGVGVAVLDGAERLADGVRGGGAGRHDVDAGALGAELDGDLAAGHVGDHRRDEVGGDPLAGLVLEELLQLALDGREAADTGADIGAQTARLDVLAAHQAGVVHRLPGGSHRIDGEGILLADERLVHPVFFRIEIPDHAADLDGQVICRELCDMVNSAHAVDKVVPKSLDIVSDAREDAESGHNYSFLHKRINFIRRKGSK